MSNTGHLRQLEVLPERTGSFRVSIIFHSAFSAPWRLTIERATKDWDVELASWAKQARRDFMVSSPLQMYEELDRTPFITERALVGVDKDLDTELRRASTMTSLVEENILDGWTAVVSFDDAGRTNSFKLRFAGTDRREYALLRAAIQIGRAALSAPRSLEALRLLD